MFNAQRPIVYFIQQKLEGVKALFTRLSTAVNTKPKPTTCRVCCLNNIKWNDAHGKCARMEVRHVTANPRNEYASHLRWLLNFN